MKYLKFILPIVFLPIFLLGAVGFGFTLNKLDKMRMIRGTKPGATVYEHAVLKRWVDESFYMIQFAEGEDPDAPGDHRFNRPPDVWEQYEVGDPIEVVRVPGDPWAYHREDIFVSDSNFTFDTALLAVEGAMMLFSVLGALGLFWLLSRFERKRAPQADAGFWLESHAD